MSAYLTSDAALQLAIAALAIAGVAMLWRLRSRAVQRATKRRSAGYKLIDCLKAYTAWIDWHRDEPLLHRPRAELGLPAALAQAVQIKDEHFPQLAPLMLRLLQEHRELMQYLWEDNILRLTHSAPRRPHYADPRYHQLRDQQDSTLDSLFMQCRRLIGDSEVTWTRTHSDFSFSSGMNHMSSQPSTP